MFIHAHSKQISLHKNTVRKRMKGGLNSYVAKNVPKIPLPDRQFRIHWLRERTAATIHEWKSVLWSDESRFTLDGPDGNMRI